MRWRRRKRSGDLVDRRGQRSLGPAAIGAGVGLPGLLVLLLVLFLGGDDASTTGLDDILGDLNNPQEAGEGLPREQDPDARLVDFMSFVLDDVQNFWQDTFRQSGKNYERAELVLFTDVTRSACGTATSQIGPHYCPPDQRVYLDLGFFRELRARFDAPGDFAQAYVLAHEIGHHVQNLLGINERVQREQQSSPDEANELSVRLELQADCLAGVWAFTTYERELLERGDLEEGLGAAAAVGDDRIQKSIQGRVNPEKWTHGSAEQRQTWFATGYQRGDVAACDTFRGRI
jgi:uncharacterized protein